MKRACLIILAALLVLPCCAGPRLETKYLELAGEDLAPKTSSEKLDLYLGEAGQPYRELGVIQIVSTEDSADTKEMWQLMVDKARQVGADAVVKIKTERPWVVEPPKLPGNVPHIRPEGPYRAYLEGVAVKYMGEAASPLEKGLMIAPEE